MNFIDIENAGFQSLPVKQQIEVEGIVLRFDQGTNQQGQISPGFTKRANSATVLKPPQGNLTQLIQRCEQYYQDKGLTCIFRLPSFAQNQKFDDYLADSSYQLIDKTLVLHLSLNAKKFKPESLTIKQPSEWLKSYCTIKKAAPETQQHLIDRLNRIKHKKLFAVLSEGNNELACGVAVISNQYCGIFNVITEQASRNKGVGTRLLNGILNWAVTNGATNTYIQVVANNLPAINLYKKLGYQYAYEYHYRVQSKL